MTTGRGAIGEAEPYDLLVIGGGINGVGIARDAVGRGLRVLLCEQADLAQFTSSASTKLIHGGLRYLESFAFRLVREALAERERLLRLAPHLIWPLRFVLPHEPGLRPAWLLRVGLFLYDHLTRLRTLPGSAMVDLRAGPLGEPLRGRLIRGFAYSDCWVEDSRFVVLNARDARARGAEIRTRTALVSARRAGGLWHATLRDETTGAIRSVRARAIVNAAGPWVSELLGRNLALTSRARVRLVKGSHIVVRALHAGAHAYILQQPDKRIVFAIPYERDFTLIGTTDIPHDGPPGPVAISDAETAYLCACINRSFARAIGPGDVVWSYAGLRPLFDDAKASASAVTRDYVLDLDAPEGEAPALSVFGGKITTYRRLAEHALERLAPTFPGLGPSWTAEALLPGGDLGGSFEAFAESFARAAPFLAPETARRLARAYGTEAHAVIGGARTLADLGEIFGADLSAAEVDHLVRHEWARTADDILWRRSKLGLRIPAEGIARLKAYLACHAGTAPVGFAGATDATAGARSP